MMGVYIKGMEMPKGCDICPFMKTNDDLSVEDYRYMYCDFPGIGEFVTDYEATRHPDCPLVPVPPHGRLIDADALMRHCVMLPRDGGSLPVVYASYLRNAPTIIQPEETNKEATNDQNNS